MGFWTWLQRKATFEPKTYVNEGLDDLGSPKDALKKFEALSLSTKFSSKNKAWFKKPQGNKPTYVFFGGSEFDPRAPQYQEHIRMLQNQHPNMGIMVVSYPGFAGSNGSPTEQGCYAAGEAAIRLLNEQNITDENLILSGYSLGSGVAIEMAKNHPKIPKLNLISPVDNIIEVAKEVIDETNFLPKIIRKASRWIADHWFQEKFDSINKLSSLNPRLKISVLAAQNDHMQTSIDRLVDKLQQQKKDFSYNVVRYSNHDTVISSQDSFSNALKTLDTHASASPTSTPGHIIKKVSIAKQPF